MSEDKRVWGYKDGEAKLFEDKLPAGWSDSPQPKKKKASKKK